MDCFIEFLKGLGLDVADDATDLTDDQIDAGLAAIRKASTEALEAKDRDEAEELASVKSELEKVQADRAEVAAELEALASVFAEPAPAPAPVFSTGLRSDRRPKRHREREFEFLDRVDQPFYEAIRTLIDQWFERFPDDDNKADLRARLRGDEIDHRSAFWELWLHEYFVRSGCSIEVHPESPEGPRRRDFLVHSPKKGSFYLEAHCVFDSKGDRSGERRLEAFRTGLQERLRLPNHAVLLFVESIGKDPLPVRRYEGLVNQAAPSVGPGQHASVIREWTTDGWQLELYLFGLTEPSSAGLTEVALGQVTVDSFTSRHIAPVRKAIAKKAKQASTLDLPYVLAVNLCVRHQCAIRPVDIHQALIGTDGSFLAGKNAHSTSISALIVGNDMAPDWVAARLPVVYHHPEPRRVITTSFGLPKAEISANRAAEPLISESSRPAYEIFKLPQDWPGHEPFELDSEG